MTEKTMKMNKTFDVKSMVLCSLFASLSCIGAFIQIPLPNSDYFTLQYLFVMLTGMLLGSKRALISISSYVFMGLIGLPVFAAGGGIGYLLKPTFGYLLGSILSAYLVGYLCEKLNANSFSKFFISGLSGFLVIYIVGFAYKYMILNFYLSFKIPFIAILLSAFPIDMPGDFIMTILASILAVKIKRVVKI